MHPNKEMNLFSKFEVFKDKLKMYLNQNSVNIGVSGLPFLTKLNAPINNSKCITFTLLGLRNIIKRLNIEFF